MPQPYPQASDPNAEANSPANSAVPSRCSRILCSRSLSSLI